MLYGNWKTMVAVGLLACTAGCGEQGSDKGAVQEDTTALNQIAADPVLAEGQQVYRSYCLACHQATGAGVPGLYPPLEGTEWVSGDKGRLIRLLLNGMSGPVEVKGTLYNNAMPAHGFLSDEEVSAVLTYVRYRFGDGESGPVTPDEVQAVRAANTQKGPWKAPELREQTGIPGE